MIYKILMYLFFILITSSFSQEKLFNKTVTIDTSEFQNSAHHWYDIKDTDKIIEPLINQKKYLSIEYEKIADNILLYQKSNGGWPKNYDMQAVLSDDQKNIVLESKNILNTCFDNSATFSHLNYLAKTFSISKQEKYKIAFTEGINFILTAQYENGGWPQFYPDTSSYRKFITFNDGAMIGVMKLLQRIVNRDSDFNIIDKELFERVYISFEKGIECILNSQIKESDSLLVWCQQHSNINLKPEAARSYEPAAICNGESAEIVEFLMSLNKPNARIIESIKSALNWFEASKIFGVKIKTISAPHSEFQYSVSDLDKIVVEDSNAKPIWARYYSLDTHIPFFCNRNGNIVYSFSEVDRERRIGYAWYVYNPQKVIDNYQLWFSEINEN